MGDESYVQVTVTIGNAVTVAGTQDGVPASVTDALSTDVRADETITILSRLVEKDGLQERDEFALLGMCLFDKLFQSKARKFIQEQLEHVPAGKILRLVLQFESTADALAPLPWEFLHVPADVSPTRSGFVASMDELILSRRVNVQARFDEKARPIKILVGIASPAHEVHNKITIGMPNSVDIGKLETALKKLNERPDDFEVRIVHGLTEVQLQKLVSEEFKPHIVHLAAHGKYENDKGYLAFCSNDDPSVAHWVADERLGDLFQGKGAAVVFLHACSTAHSGSFKGFRGMALQLLKRGVPAVVAMSFEIKVETASDFAVKFYEGLAEGLPVDHAVQRGRKYVGIPEGSTTSFEGRAFGCPVAFVQVGKGLVLARPATVELPPAPPAEAEQSDLLHCPACQWPVPATYRICPNTACGKRIKKCPTPDCPAMMQDGFYCSVCGLDERATTPAQTGYERMGRAARAAGADPGIAAMASDQVVRGS